ncbi:DUF2201 family putative metallopeptidase (plasmid) [Streptomyces sp. BI20]|uniref:vWA domain-containing protein n=1 Tax=Streptomyces sp. BI20 TaxID=3403460 RepID=UPI003C74101B
MRPVPTPLPPVSPAAPSGAEPALDEGKLYAARLLAVERRPYLAAALFALHVVPDARIPTMGVDPYWRCYVSPRFVARTPIEELAGVWVHEVSHLLREHHARGDRYLAAEGPVAFADRGERLRVNIAADCEINDDAYGEGLARPAGAVVPADLGMGVGLLMEEYLREFRLGPRTAGLVWLDCGSGADGAGRPWDLGPEGADGLAPHERDAVRFRVARGITGRPGSAPRGWRRWAEEALQPPQPWARLLGDAVRAAVGGSGAGAHHTYARPARRSAAVPGAVLPSPRRRLPRVAVIVDTSGSVSDRELGTALREIAEIGRALGGRRDRLRVLSCDAAVHRVRELCADEGLVLVGGGGTDLRAGFAAALRSGPRPDVVVVLTDGQTPWPASRPSCRTVVGLFPRPVRDEGVEEGGGDGDDEEVWAWRRREPPGWARVVVLSR